MPACLVCCFSVNSTPRIAATNSISSLSLQTWDSACLSIPVKFLIVTTSNTRFIGPTRVLNPSGISIASAVFTGLTSVTDRPTDRQTNRATDRHTTLLGLAYGGRWTVCLELSQTASTVHLLLAVHTPPSSNLYLISSHVFQSRIFCSSLSASLTHVQKVEIVGLFVLCQCFQSRPYYVEI